MRNSIRRIGQRLLPITIGLLLTLAGIVTQLAPTEGMARVLQRVNSLVYDLRLAFVDFPHQASSYPIVFVDVDEQSLESQGRWPWSRSTIAELSRRLLEEGSLVIGFDVMFSEPEINPVRQVGEALGPVPESVANRLQQLEHELDADERLAGVLSEGDFVLGFLLHRQNSTTGTPLKGQLPDPAYPKPVSNLPELLVTEMPAATGNLPVLQSAAIAGGFITTIPDPDGLLRKTPAVLTFGDRLYPSLTVAIAQTLLFEDQLTLNTTSVGSATALTSIEIADLEIPTDAKGNLLIPYRKGKPGYQTVSAADVLAGQTGHVDLQNALVIVGSSAIGLGDLVSTPVNPAMPGATVHARVLEGILTENLPYRPDWAPGAELAASVFVGVILSLFLPLMPPIGMIVLAFGAVAAVILANGMLWARQSLDLALATVVLIAMVILLVNLLEQLLRENRGRKRIKKMFGEYVPSAHINAMLRDPKAYNFAGDSREMTVLFSDIRSFTTISETLSASELKTMLNRYFTPITRTIFEHDGTVDKYVGDMVMAFWGAPLKDENHATHAVLAALSMLEITEKLKEDFRRDGLPEINIGIGVNTGTMSVGDMGSNYRRAYTVLGDAVNLGARLESITKFYGARLLVGPATRAQATGICFRLVDRIVVKGKKEAVTVYEPLGREGEVCETEIEACERHHLALDAYYRQQWNAAEKIWQALFAAEPTSQLYRLYLERVASLRRAPPPASWDGTYVHTSK